MVEGKKLMYTFVCAKIKKGFRNNPETLVATGGNYWIRTSDPSAFRTKCPEPTELNFRIFMSC